MMHDTEICKAHLRWAIKAAAEIVLEYEPDVMVSTEPPLVHNKFTHTMRCGHGVPYYVEPTSEQMLFWAERKTP